MRQDNSVAKIFACMPSCINYLTTWTLQVHWKWGKIDRVPTKLYKRHFGDFWYAHQALFFVLLLSQFSLSLWPNLVYEPWRCKSTWFTSLRKKSCFQEVNLRKNWSVYKMRFSVRHFRHIFKHILGISLHRETCQYHFYVSFAKFKVFHLGPFINHVVNTEVTKWQKKGQKNWKKGQKGAKKWSKRGQKVTKKGPKRGQKVIKK